MFPRLFIAVVLLGFTIAGTVHAADPTVESIDDQKFEFELPGSRITIDFRDTTLLDKKDILLEWVLYSAQTVQHYYGRFPVRTVNIALEASGGGKVRSGVAFGGGNPHLRITVGEHITADTLRRDWIMVHEMVHLALANVPRKHRWLSEGLATYVESIARTQTDHLSEDFTWKGFVKNMPQGLPESGDLGLDRTPTWGRTYWGGAMFCLLADVEIRKLTNNDKSLREAMRGVLDAGLSMHTSAPVMKVFEVADRAIGVDVLVPMYQKMKHDPYPVDLENLWNELGVSLSEGRVIYNDEAPMAHVRKDFLKS